MSVLGEMVLIHSCFINLEVIPYQRSFAEDVIKEKRHCIEAVLLSLLANMSWYIKLYSEDESNNCKLYLISIILTIGFVLFSLVVHQQDRCTNLFKRIVRDEV